jgi:peptidoglycan/LPS O-acetylase OafA/YrhL
MGHTAQPLIAESQLPGPMARPHYPGLNWARVVAVLLVTSQHALSVGGRIEWTSFGEFGLGRTGVALFLAISGLMAGADWREPWPWLKQRLTRIYPAYWIAISFGFLLNWLVAYKPATLPQFVWQMFGLGVFTHRDQLVNVASWFVSFVVLLYGLAFLCRISQKPVLTAACLLILALVLSLRYDPTMASHAANFFTAFMIGATAMETRTRFHLFAGATLVAAGLGFLVPQLWVTAAGLGLTGGALLVNSSSSLVDWLARYSYEFYLVHGIFLVGAAKYVSLPYGTGVILGILGALMGAVALNTFVAYIQGLMRGCEKVSPPAPLHSP